MILNWIFISEPAREVHKLLDATHNLADVNTLMRKLFILSVILKAMLLKTSDSESEPAVSSEYDCVSHNKKRYKIILAVFSTAGYHSYHFHLLYYLYSYMHNTCYNITLTVIPSDFYLPSLVMACCKAAEMFDD